MIHEAGRGRVRWCALAAFCAAFVGAAEQARADEAMAESLYRAAEEQMAAKNYKDACPKYAESYRQSPANGTLASMGECYVKNGQSASAWAAFQRLAFEAKKKGDSARYDLAVKRIDELEPGLSKLRIDVADANVPGLQVRRDEEDIPKAALGTAIAVDPGSHTIFATAPGFEVWQTTVSVGAKADQKTVTIPTLVKKPVEAQPPAGGAAGGSAAPVETGTKRTVGWIVGGTGVAVLAVGGVMGGLTLGDASKVNGDAALCGSAGFHCTAAGKAALDSANGKATVATILVPVGAAALGVGAFLVLTSKPAGAKVGLEVLPGGARVVGTF